MASVATMVGLTPRYGSPAEVAAFLGPSSKTIRRLIAAGTVPAYRVGRRVLVSYRDADQLIRQQRRARTMSIAPTPVSPHRSVDARGRALPMTDEEIRRRNAEAIRALDSLDEIGDEEEQRATFEALMVAIDEEPLSDRKRFR
jgi:excisionase family DNA binding protein